MDSTLRVDGSTAYIIKTMASMENIRESTQWICTGPITTPTQGISSGNNEDIWKG